MNMNSLQHVQDLPHWYLLYLFELHHVSVVSLIDNHRGDEVNSLCQDRFNVRNAVWSYRDLFNKFCMACV